MKTKFCAKCCKNLSVDLFGKAKNKDGLKSYCKTCCALASKESYHRHIEKKREYDRLRYQRDKEKRLKANSIWISENHEKHKKNARDWYFKNKDKKIKQNAETYKKKYKKDKVYTADRIVRRQIQRVIDDSKSVKTFKVYEKLGYSLDEFIQNIESKFQSNMSWENYGLWHIDHIEPVSFFLKKNITDPAIINSLDNLQPLWAADNLSKGAKHECGASKSP